MNTFSNMKVANRLAAGDLGVSIEVDSRDEIGQLKSALQGMVAKLAQIIGEVRGSANALTSTSEEVSSTAQSMSQASSEQAASVEQMSASITQNTDNVRARPTAKQSALAPGKAGSPRDSAVPAGFVRFQE